LTPKPRRALGVLYVRWTPPTAASTWAIGTPDKAHSKAGLDIPLTIKGDGSTAKPA